MVYQHPEIASLGSDSAVITQTLLLADPGVSDLATQIAPIRLPLKPGKAALRPVEWRGGEGRLELEIPQRQLREVRVGRYRARPVPRAMLGGLILRTGSSKERLLKDLYFTVQEQASEDVRPCAPGVGWDVVSLYAPRTRTRSVLARADWDFVESEHPYGRFALPLVARGEPCPAESSAPAPDPSASPAALPSPLPRSTPTS